MTTDAKPKSLFDLYSAFSQLALQGFGGVLAIAQRELVERRHWLSNDEFVEDWSVAQTIPGPNIVNFSLTIGARHFGLRGAIVAVAGLLTFPMIIVLTLALVYTRFGGDPHVAGALRGLGSVAAGLMLGSALKLSATLKSNPLGIPVSIAFGIACFVANVLLRWPLIYVLLGLGLSSCLLAYWRLKA